MSAASLFKWDHHALESDDEIVLARRPALDNRCMTQFALGDRFRCKGERVKGDYVCAECRRRK